MSLNGGVYRATLLNASSVDLQHHSLIALGERGVEDAAGDPDA